MNDLTILLPALNEEETIVSCINKCQDVLSKNDIRADILVVNNNSSDDTAKLVKETDAILVNEQQVGYGNAIICGINYIKTKYCIMLDSDCSYNFEDIPKFYKKLKEGYDFVIGDRFKGGIEKSAMPISHRYLGTPFISFVGRKLHSNNIHDYNCGLRGFDVNKIKNLNLKSSGMEIASEMIIASAKASLNICELPTKYFKDKRTHSGHLKTIPDGLRHIRIILAYKKIASDEK